MSDPETHAETVAKFYKKLHEGDIPTDVAGVCTIEFNKALLQKAPPVVPPDKDAERAAIRAASDRKAAERAERLAKA